MSAKNQTQQAAANAVYDPIERVLINLPRSLLDRIESYWPMQRFSRNSVVRKILTHHLDELDKLNDRNGATANDPEG